MKYPLSEHILSALLNIVTLNFYGMVKRGTHIAMIDMYTSVHCHASFADLKRALSKVDWHCRGGYNSLFCDAKNEYHAKIIMIDGVGYLMSTYGFIRAERLKNKMIKKILGKTSRVVPVPAEH